MRKACGACSGAARTSTIWICPAGTPATSGIWSSCFPAATCCTGWTCRSGTPAM
ncbi:MAG: hypothetical protein ABS888_01355 [Eubacteriales bacterium]